MEKKPVIVIVGPTGTGKSKLAIDIATVLKSPVISADSRKVYKYLDIGTNKERLLDALDKKLIPSLHLVDVVTPDKRFTVYDFLKECKKVFKKAHAQGKIPIVVGGTVMYITALLKGYTLRKTKPDLKKRAQLEKKSLLQLQLILQSDYPSIWNNLNESEQKNARRLVRWLEIAGQTVKPKEKTEVMYDFHTIPLIPPKEETYELIKARVEKMIDQGLIVETDKLLKTYSKNSVGLQTMGYKEVVEYLEGSLSQEALVERIIIRHRRYAKYQVRWIKTKLFKEFN